MGRNLYDILTVAHYEIQANCKGGDCFDCELDSTWCAVKRLANKAIIYKQLKDGGLNNGLHDEYDREYHRTIRDLNEVLDRMREL